MAGQAPRRLVDYIEADYRRYNPTSTSDRPDPATFLILKATLTLKMLGAGVILVSAAPPGRLWVRSPLSL